MNTKNGNQIFLSDLCRKPGEAAPAASPIDLNALEPGRVLRLNGYNNPEFIILENQGIEPRRTQWGARYLCYKEGGFYHHVEAYTLKHISQKADDRIQTYVTNEIKTPEEVEALKKDVSEKEKARLEGKEKADQERRELIAQGKELFKKHIPETAQALIIAAQDIDASDSQSDLYSTNTAALVIVGYSNHKRDLFPELRKHADRIPETAHLIKADPETEHREKYSMGKGFYLKAGGTYSTGWTIYKKAKYGDWSEEFYIAIAKRCCFASRP